MSHTPALPGSPKASLQRPSKGIEGTFFASTSLAEYARAILRPRLQFQLLDLRVDLSESARLSGEADGIDPLGGIELGDLYRLLQEEALTLLTILRGDLPVGITEATEKLRIADLAAVDTTLNLRSQPIGPHHIPSAGALRSIPQRLELEEGFILQVPSLIEDNQRIIQPLEVVDQVGIDLFVAPLSIQAKADSDRADQADLRLRLRAVDIYDVLVRAGIVASAEGLPDIRDVAEEGAEAALLAGFQLAGDVGLGIGLCDLPLDLPAQGYIEAACKAEPR